MSLAALESWLYIKFNAIYSIAENLESAKSSYLPLFHALTGYDQVSFSVGRGKKKARNTWKQYDELTDVLGYISVSPSQENVNKALPTLR